MANKAELWSQLRYIIKLLDWVFTTNNTSLKGYITAVQNGYAGDHIKATETALGNYRNSFSNLLGVATPLEAVIVELARVGYASLNTNVGYCLNDIGVGMAALSETVSSRAYTIGGISASGSNVGNGVIIATSKDLYNTLIESGWYSTGAFKYNCTSDRYTGSTAGSETFTLFSTGLPPIDNLDKGVGTPAVKTLTVASSTNGSSILTNGNWATYTATPTKTIDSWTIASTANLTLNTTTKYGANTVSAEFTGDNSLTQSQTAFTTSFDRTRPLGVIVRVRRETSCDGNLIITVGSKAETTACSSLTNGVWTNVYWGIGNSNGWYENFKQNTVNLKVELASRTTGSLIIGEVLAVYGTLYDNQFFTVVRGTTDFLRGDNFTQTNSVSNTGRVQTTISRLYGAYLPHTSGTPTYADL